jgi:hypothetical protein
MRVCCIFIILKMRGGGKRDATEQEVGQIWDLLGRKRK